MNNSFQYIHTNSIDVISGGDTGFKKELIEIFLEQIPDFISNITTFYKKKDFERLAHEAHTAKSSVLTFGMNEAGYLLKEIQVSAETNKPDRLKTLISKVIIQFGAAVNELKALQKSI